MFEGLGRLMYRRRRWVLGLTLAFTVFSGVWGTQVFGALVGGGFDDPASESVRAAERAAERLGRDEPDVVVVYRDDAGTVDDPGFRQAVTSTLAALPSDAVERTVTYWSSGSPTLVSEDRRATYAVVVLRGDEGERTEHLERIEDALVAPGLETSVGGTTTINRDISTRVSADIARAEMLSVPVLLVLLVLVFGGLTAASLPLAVGGVAILGSFAALRALTYGTDVSIFSVNVVTILGLGLAIDYGLFVVSRFREELARTDDVAGAVARTMATAGRTVAVSGATVAVALAGLLLFPQVFLRSMGLGGLAAVLIAMVAALTVLPALLGVLGHRVDALAVPRLRLRRRDRAGGPAPQNTGTQNPAPQNPAPQNAGTQDAGGVERGAWFRLAQSIMRRPVVYTVGVLALLIALGLPFLRVEFGGVDARVLPAATESRQVSETLDRDFTPNVASPIEAVVTLPSAVGTPDGRAALAGYVRAVTALPGVIGAQVTAAVGDTARVDVGYAAEPQSDEARRLVGRVRAVPPPNGGEVLVGGPTAELVDRLDSIGDRLPWMALVVGVATFVLLFLAFGSVVLPLKAIAMNVVSLGASFGALVWLFQDGHLAGVLDFTATGTLEATQPILVLAIVFGLSTDYEVFLMSRIRERYDHTGDNRLAVAEGLQRTGRIITSAALLLLVVIAAFSLSGITFIKMIGVAMVIAVLVDATVVRALLVPATMRLLGRANWWAPGPLRRLYARYGIREDDDPAPRSGAGHTASESGSHPVAVPG